MQCWRFRSFLFLLLIVGSFGVASACGRVADEVGNDGGREDATPDSTGDASVTDGAARPRSDVEAGDTSVITDATSEEDAPPCPVAGDSGPQPLSCAPGGSGMTNCGACQESCCTSREVEGGTYYRTYTNSGGGPTGEANPATVSSFRLDKYEVTVGRFRQFVNAVMPTDAGPGGYSPTTG